MAEISIKSYLISDDPLSDAACLYLLNYKEENNHVDFKEEFKIDTDKSWIDLAIDVAAFSNTEGGYIIFGIRDKTYEKIGITDAAKKALVDIKVVREKINISMQPKFTKIRTTSKVMDDKAYVFLYAPPTLNRIHVFEQGRDIRLPDGKSKQRVKQGAIYVRKTGSNEILTSDSLEEIINRRIDLYRNKIMEGMARVVKSNLDQDTIIVSELTDEGGQKSLVVKDSPQAANIKDIKLISTPVTLEDKVAVWIAVFNDNNNNIPPIESIMELYENRKIIKLSQDQFKQISYFSIVQGLPAFYWLTKLSKKNSLEVIKESFDSSGFIEKIGALNISGFYGQPNYDRLYQKLSKEELDRGVKKFKNLKTLFNTDKKAQNVENENSATKLAKDLSNEFSRQKLYDLIKLDCAIYAPFDNN